MTDDNQNDTQIGQEARTAVEHGGDIRGDVRDIVTRALGGQPLEPGSLGRVLKLVLEGAAEGVPEGATEASVAMRKAGEGIEDAMGRVAEASKLAIEEARSREDEFTETELKRATQDLLTLDRLYIDTMQDFAKAGATTARKTIGDLATHMERSGSDAITAIREAANVLRKGAASSERPHLSDVNRAAKTGVGTIAAIGSAILGGIAEGLEAAKDKPNSDASKKDA